MIRMTRIISELGVALLAMSLMLVILQSYAAFVVFAALGAAAGLAVLMGVIVNREALRFCWIVAGTLLLGYGGGIVSAWFNAVSSEEFVYLAKDRPFGLLCAALALVYACCGVALLVGRWEPSCLKGATLPDRPTPFSAVFVACSLAAIAAAYVFGAIGYMGVQVEEATSRISAWGAIADLLAAPTVGICCYMAARAKRAPERFGYAFSACLGLISIVPSGRRLIVLALLICALGFCLSGALRRSNPAKLAVGVVVAVVFAFLATSYFYALRLSIWELGPTSQFSDQLSLAFEFLTSPSLHERFSSLLSENLRERTFTIGYLADLLEAAYRSAPLYGEALEFYIRVAIPSALDPGKSAVLDYQQIENLAHPKLGLPVIDQANSILTDGITDFFAPGGFVYMFGLIGLLAGSAWMLRYWAQPVTRLFGAMVLIHLALKPELTLADYFATLRNLALLYPFLFVLERMMATRPSAAAAADATVSARVEPARTDSSSG